MNKRISIVYKLVFAAFASFGCVAAASFNNVSFKKAKAESFQYVNDLAGVYSVVAYENDNVEYGLDIYGGYVCTNDDNSPIMQVHSLGKPVQANQRFEFHYIETVNDRAIYYITSSLDNNGRVDVKGSSIAENTSLYYHYFNNDSTSQKWCVRTNDGGKTVQICHANNPEFMISYNDAKACVISKDATYWTLKLCAGDYGINTRTYLVGDNTNYAYTTSNERWRYLEPIDKSGYISDIINVGVEGEGITKTTYNSVQAFAVPYQSHFYIDTSFVYSNSIYGEWKQGKDLGKANCDGGYLVWHVGDDSYEIRGTGDTFTSKIGIGAYAIEISNDNSKWEFYHIVPFTSSNRQIDKWELDGKLLAKGVYVRVSYLFEIYATWWQKTFLWWGEDKYAYKNVREVSDSFFVCADGFGEQDFGVISIHNNSSKNALSNIDNGLTLEENTVLETLTDNSLTTSGFVVNSAFPSYKIELQKNDGEYFVINDGYEVTDSGRYTIKATSKFGKTMSKTVYVTKSEELVNTYFGKTFANEPNEVAFLQGTRILSGRNSYLDSVGLTLNYAFAEYPVYKKGCTVNIKSPAYTLPLVGNIYYETMDGEHILPVDTTNGEVHLTIEESGAYGAQLSTINSVGDVLTFSFRWYVAENSPGPFINKALITTRSQETYDLLPVYYGVRVDGDRYTFKEGENTVEKMQSIFYAFASYNSAYQFALRVEKEYAMYKGDGLYTYAKATNPQANYNEYELFVEMSANAKANVNKRYFSKTNTESMKIFTPYDQNGNVRKYDDGITETVAYCLEQDTNQCVVTSNKVELNALTSRQPYINDYSFVSVPLDSYTVTLTDEHGEEYDIEYDTPVGEQLRNEYADSGKYTVTETSIFGEVTTYDVYYIARNSKCDAVVTLEIDGNEVVVTSEDNGHTFTGLTYFAVKSAVNKNDKHSLLLISKNKVDYAYDINSINDIFDTIQQDVGTYTMLVEDRMGNHFTVTFVI